MNDRKKFSSNNNNMPNRDTDSRENEIGGYDDKQLYGANMNRERSTTDNSRRYNRERGSDTGR